MLVLSTVDVILSHHFDLGILVVLLCGLLGTFCCCLLSLASPDFLDLDLALLEGVFCRIQRFAAFRSQGILQPIELNDVN